MHSASNADDVDEGSDKREAGQKSPPCGPHTAVYLRAPRPSLLRRIARSLAHPWQALPRWGQISTIVAPIALVCAILVLPLGGAAVSSGRVGPSLDATADLPVSARGPSPTGYTVVEAKDASIRGRTRTILRVAIHDENASTAQVRAALLDAVLNHPDTDAILAWGYWPGDDTASHFTAGQLEWARDGRGWSGNSRTADDGCFSAGEAPLR